MPETLHRAHYILYVIFGLRLVDSRRQGICGRIQFKDRVVHQMQGLCNFGATEACGIGEHRYCGRREKPVPEFNGIPNNLRELRIEGGFAVPGEGYGVDGSTVGSAGTQFFFEQRLYLRRRGKPPVCSAVGIPAAFTVNAVEIAELALRRKQVNPEGIPQPS